MNRLSIASIVLLALAGTPLVGWSGTEPGADVANRPWISVDSGRAQWPIAREPSGQWGVVGEAVARHTGAGPVEVTSVTFTVLNRRGRLLHAEVFDTPAAIGEIVLVFHRDASGSTSFKPAGTTVLDPGDIGVAFLAALTGPHDVPDRARVTLRFSHGPARTFAVPLEVFDAGQRMGWPLRLDGDPWLALNTAGTAHHWVGSTVPTDDGLFIGQRFAIDLVQIDAEGQTHPAFATSKESYYAWGEEILSAGRGRVIAVERDARDIEIGEVPATDNPFGNYVVVQHGRRLFSVHAHMQQASATVNVGDWVERGDLLGLVGNSGNTTEPHLHVHFAGAWPASPNPLNSLIYTQGVPALFWDAQVLRDGRVFRLNGSTPLELDVILGPWRYAPR